MACIFDIFAEFNYHFNVTATFLYVVSLISTSPLTHNFQILLEIIKILIYPIQFSVPFIWIQLSFNYHVVVRFLHVIELKIFPLPILAWVKEIYFCFFNTPSVVFRTRFFPFWRVSYFPSFDAVYKHRRIVISQLFFLFVTFFFLVWRKLGRRKLEFSSIKLKVQKLVYYVADLIAMPLLNLLSLECLGPRIAELFEITDKLVDCFKYVGLEILKRNERA